jgi:hypothetical protein
MTISTIHSKSNFLIRITIKKLVILILGLSAFGYPISVGFGLLLNLPTQPLNIAYRVIVLFISFILILNQLQKYRSKIMISKVNSLFLIFWLIYTIRLFYDLFIINVPYGVGMGSKSFILLFAYGSCFLPATAIMLAKFDFDFKPYIGILFKMAALANIFIFLVLINENGLSLQMFLTRATVLNNEEASPLNSITISLAGSLLTILSLIRWNISFFRNQVSNKVLISILFLLGLFNLFAGASRSPIAITFIIISLAYYKFWVLKKRSIFYLIKTFSLLFLLTFVLSVFIAPKIKNFDFVFIGRVLSTLDKDKVKENRDYSIEAAWGDFLHAPLLGNSFVGSYDGFYPHSILVEVPMSTGIIGSVFFFSYFLIVFIRSIKLMNKGKQYIFITSIFLSFFIISTTSGSIFFSHELWIWSMFISKIYYS